ncbi:hypothetical protein B5G20_06625 [Collinsella sp. An7]|uniref:glycosyltransferase n=1 Tax=Collinsella sp. An7 TaxID=1965651 RepID=UPI000B39D71A|nr:glycosyltransferase [Collinsella sp. An7]OUN46634.1 hypothetical protein B5G20_06625 [Collinsella sp. An7]
MSSFDLSIICVYNNLEQYGRLVESIGCLDCQVELVGLDNRNNKWKSAASAYNEGVRLAHAPVLLFSHQDIVFLGSSFVSDFLKRAGSNESEIIGVAGARLTDDGHGRFMCSGMYQGSKLWRHHTALVPTSAQTLDECLFGCSAKVFDCLSFDDEACDGWHFYAVDFCLQAGLAGMAVTVLPADVIHESGGTRDASYYLAQEKIKEKYASVFEAIPTTCGWTRTRDIDPYRPIIDDELAALQNAGCSYHLNFYLSLLEAFDLHNTFFFPSVAAIRGAASYNACEEDVPFLEYVRSGSSISEAIEFAISINNFIADRRWLYADLIDLKLDYPNAMLEKYTSSRAYRFGHKVFFWDKTEKRIAAELKNQIEGRDEHPLAKQKGNSCAFNVPTEYSLDAISASFDNGIELFREYLLQGCTNFIQEVSSDSKAEEIVVAILNGMKQSIEASDALQSLFLLKEKSDELDSRADWVRMTFEHSAAYRLSANLRKVLSVLPHVGSLNL